MMRLIRVALVGWVVSACALGPAASATNYIIEKNIAIPIGDGATVCAWVVRPTGDSPRPAALEFTIYVDPQQDVTRLEYAADRGYAGVMAYTRGKACSPQTIAPYEHDGHDANSVIDWIARQPWSDGQIGMMGGSYDGFTQWAAAKFANEHLKTIVPVVPNNPGNGLPMQNNVFILANYAWVYYTTDNKTLDDTTYQDSKWAALPLRWYRSGRSYQDLDAIAGVPNPWLHKWLQHPGYDAYWQRMSPYHGDYARIRIPVLTVTGYYGDSTAIGYFNALRRYNPAAQSYLVAGPWDHFGSQGRHKPAILRGYHIDPAADIDTWKLTFDWFDFVMRGKPRPALVRNRVNYEVMGENRWRHAPSLDAMGAPQRLYLTDTRTRGSFYLLAAAPPQQVSALHQEVNLADRTTMNNDSYPYIIFDKKPDLSNGYAFLTAPFPRSEEVSGFDGVVHLRVNKRDLDVGLGLYEMLPDGKLFQLTYYTERASYAADMSVRHLLTPGRDASVPFEQDYLFSRWVAKGNRLLLTVNVNKNAFAEVNYGTGKDVGQESVNDAGSPMQVQWLTSSYIRLRVHDPDTMTPPPAVRGGRRFVLRSPPGPPRRASYSLRRS
ncbi:MAG TPA: CocE/NonD family hydrolase [Steroidobacteraceae bacterium]